MRRQRAALVAAALGMLPVSAIADAASWVAPVNGSWTDGSKWSTAPNFPGSDDEAQIIATGAPYTVQFNVGSLQLSAIDFLLDAPQATFAHSSGELLTSSVQVGDGTYALSGGTLTCSFVSMGDFGVGTFLQTNGMVRAVSGFNVGATPGAVGFYQINNGTLQTNAMSATDGGAIVQNGGRVSLSSELFLSEQNANQSGYLLAGGTLTTSRTRIGLGSGGTFTQTGGTHQVGELDLGGLSDPAGSSPYGTYDMSGGTLNANSILIGLPVPFAGNASSLNIHGGTVTASAISVYDGHSLTVTGGSVNVGVLELVSGANLMIGGGTVSAGGLNLAGFGATVTGGTTAGTLIVGPGNLTFSGTDNPTLIVPSDSSQVGKLILTGNVRSIISTGIASITGTPTGVGQNGAVLDLAGGTRTFDIDDGANDTDFVVSLPIASGGVIKAGAGLLQLNNPVSGTGGLIVNDGTLLLRASSSFTGPITVNGGTLRFTSDSQLGAGSNSVQLQGGTLQSGGTVFSSRTFNVVGNGNLDVIAGKQINLQNGLAGSGSLTKSGDGFLSLDGPTTFTGRFNMDGGLSVVYGPILGANALEVGPAGTLSLSSHNGPFDQVNSNCDVILNGGFFSTDNPETFGALVVNSSGSTVGGGGSFTFSKGLGTRGTAATVDFNIINFGVNTPQIFLTGQPLGFIGAWATVRGNDYAKYTANGIAPFDPIDYSTTFQPNTHVLGGGTTSLNSSITIRTLTNANLSIASGAVLTLSDGGILNGTSLSGGTIRSGNGELLVYVNSGNTLNISSQLADNVGVTTALIKSGFGTLVLGSGPFDTVANTFSGTTWVHDGTLLLNKAPGTNAVPGDLTIDGGVVTLATDNQISDNSTIIITAGTLSLNGRNETIHSLKNKGGTLITGSGTLTILSPNTLSLEGGVTTVSNNRFITTPSLSVSGGNNTIQRGANVQVGTGGFTMTNAQGANPTLFLEADDIVPATVTLTAGSNINFIGISGTGNIGGNEIAGVLDLSGATHTVTVSDGTADVDLSISARIINGGLIKSGAGTLRLLGSNTFAGGVTVNNGTLQVTSPAALGTGSLTLSGGNFAFISDAFNTGAGPNLVTGGSTLTIGRATPGTAGTVHLGSLRLNGNRLALRGAGTLEFDGDATLTGNAIIDNDPGVRITGSLLSTTGLTKIGAGTLVLRGAALASPGFAGSIAINGGMLQLDVAGPQSTSSPTTVNGPATLKLNLVNGGFTQNAGITLNSVPGPATFEIDDGAATTSSVTFVAGGIVSGNGTLTVTGPVNITGATGAATISVSGFTSTGSISVADTTAPVDLLISSFSASTPLLAGPGAVNVSSGANLSTDSANLDTLTIDGGRLKLGLQSPVTSVSKLNTLSILNAGKLDLSHNRMILDYKTTSPLSDVKSWLATGSLFSSDAATNSSHRTALGYVEASAIGAASFGGVSVDSTAVLIGYTYAGDTNLDRTVNTLDFNALANHFNQQARQWLEGDFNYDGVVNALDFNALASNFGQTLSSAPLGSLVPEPGAPMLLITIIALLGRTRRSGRP